MTETWRNRLMINLQWAASKMSYGIVNYRHPARAKVLGAVKDSYRKTYTATTPMECAEIYQAVLACEKIPETWRRLVFSSEELLSSYFPHRKNAFISLIPSRASRMGEGDFQAGEWTGSLPDVKRNLAEHESRLEFHPGFFPASTAGLDELRFSFVHLDLDLYDSTIAALEWFWPRLASGGILLSHDYPLADGVVRAFHEFFDGRVEPFIPLSGNQCLAVKP